MSTATLPRPLTPFPASTMPRCTTDPDLWHERETERRAIHECRHHCPFAARSECERRTAARPPDRRCVQAGLLWIGRPNRGERQRVPGGATVPAARQPDEEPCAECVARAEQEGRCPVCLGPMPADGDPAAVTCGPACWRRRERARSRAKCHAQHLRRTGATTPDPAGTAPAADEGER